MYDKLSVEVGGSAMEILTFVPDGDGPFPGVVVAQHLPGAHMGLEGDAFQIDVGERLAQQGYACVIPYMFHWWPADEDIAVKRAEWRDDRSIADLDAAHAALCALPGVDADRVGILGHCWGGRVAWLGACHNPNYKVCGVFYGGRIKLGMGDGAPAPIDLAGGMACDVFGGFGNTDQNPSPEDVDDLEVALTAAGVAHEFHRYDGAGHGFQTINNPDRYHPEASDDAWGKLFSYFGARLNP